MSVLSTKNSDISISSAGTKIKRLFAIEFRHKEDDDRVNFEPSQEHAPDQDPFAGGRDLGVILCRSHEAEARADVSDGGCNGAEGRGKINTNARKKDRTERKKAHVEGQEPQDAPHYPKD